MGQVTVFSGPERRRRWSDEERLQILSEAFAPGACVAEVCRRPEPMNGLTRIAVTEKSDLDDSGAGRRHRFRRRHHLRDISRKITDRGTDGGR